MFKAAWLRTWLYHGQHLLFGVAGLRVLLRGDPGAIAYSHELTAGVDAATHLIICIAFPLVALVLSGWGALILGDNAARGPGGPRRGGGAPPGPGPAPDLPDAAQLGGLTESDIALFTGLSSRHAPDPGIRHAPDPGIEQDQPMPGLADAGPGTDLGSGAVWQTTIPWLAPMRTSRPTTTGCTTTTRWPTDAQ